MAKEKYVPLIFENVDLSGDREEKLSIANNRARELNKSGEKRVKITLNVDTNFITISYADPTKI